MVTHDIRKRLLYSKYLLSRAKNTQAEGSELAVAVSLPMLHDAVELLLYSVTDHIGIGSSWNFMDFWGKVKQSGRAEPGHKIPLGQLNDLRVGFKHKWTLPHSQTVLDLMPRVEAFCEETARDLLDCDFQKLSLADLISDSDVRQTLSEAEQELSKGDRAKAFLNVRLAFDKLHRLITNDVALVRKPHGIEMPNNLLPSKTVTGIKNLQGVVFNLVDVVNRLMIGIDPVRYRFLMSNTPAVSWTMAGTYQALYPHDYSNVSDEVFNKCFGFVVDVALNASR